MKSPARRARDPVAVALAAALIGMAALPTGCRQQEREPDRTQAEPETATPKPDKEGWESLFNGKTLGRWTPSDFWKPGKVHVAGGCLVLEPGRGDLTGVTWGGDPAMLPRVDYEVRLQARRVEGSDFFCGLTFPYKDSCATLIVGGWGGGVIGISSFDGFDASQNETTTYQEFQNGKWYDIRLRVTAKRIQAWIDGENVVDTEVADRDVDVRIEVEESKPLGIAAYNTKAALRRIRLRRLLDE